MIQEVWTLLNERASFFLGLCGEHLAISLIAIIIAVLIGGALGIFMSEYQKSARLVMPIVNFLYTIPSISMLGFLIPLSGIGNLTAVIALTLYALLPMVRSTYTGLTTVNAGIIEAAEGMGSTGRQILWKIKLPLAMPIILSGIRNMVVMTLALAGIASFIGAGGLGVAIYRGITTNNAAMTVTGSLLIAALALIFDLILGKVEKRCGQHHAPSSNKRRRRPAVIGCAALAAVILSTALFLRAGRTPTIRIATKPMSEQYILGEMLDILIEENTDLNVEITQGVGGGTSNIQPAMEQGEFDIYPEYTGTAWNMVLKNDDLYTEERFDELQDAYAQDYDMEWIGMYGFNNSYALAVRSEIAQQYDLKNISDLRGIADELTFGAEYDFYAFDAGSVDVYTYVLPTFPLHADRDFRIGENTNTDTKYSVQIDDGALATPSSSHVEYSQVWFESVLRNCAVNKSTLHIDKPGRHTLRIRVGDPGIVLQKIVLDFGGMKRSYLGPQSTLIE